jgi:hypothetical protein
MDRQADQEFRGWALASRGGLVPGIQRQPVSPAAIAAATSVPVTADEGITVTNARQLLGSWWTIELDGQNVRAVRDREGSAARGEVRAVRHSAAVGR